MSKLISTLSLTTLTTMLLTRQLYAQMAVKPIIDAHIPDTPIVRAGGTYSNFAQKNDETFICSTRGSKRRPCQTVSFKHTLMLYTITWFIGYRRSLFNYARRKACSWVDFDLFHIS